MKRITATALAALTFLVGCYSEHPKFKSTDVTGADWGKELKLTGHDGKPRTLADYRGKIVVLTFGFTNCPDICPTTLADMAGVLKSLKPSEASKVQVLFMTLDPERDSPRVLAKYVPAFHPQFVGLHGDLETTQRTARDFKMFFEKRKNGNGKGYSVDHSAQSYVFDTSGRLRLMVRHERIGEDLPHDLKELLREGRKKR